MRNICLQKKKKNKIKCKFDKTMFTELLAQTGQSEIQELSEGFEIQVNWKIWQSIVICDSGTKQTSYDH